VDNRDASDLPPFRRIRAENGYLSMGPAPVWTLGVEGPNKNITRTSGQGGPPHLIIGPLSVAPATR